MVELLVVVASVVVTCLQGVYNRRRPYDDGRRSKGEATDANLFSIAG